MSKRRRRWVERLKSALILLLSLSAVYLLLQTNLLGGQQGPLTSLGALFAQPQESPPTQTGTAGSLVRPVRLVVTNPQLSGRYGAQYDQDTVDAKFSGALLNLFTDALSGAGPGKKISSALWQKALADTGRPGIYLDLMGAVTGSQLPVWLGGRTPNPHLTGQVRRLLLTADELGGAQLYYSNEEDGSYYACGTSADLLQRLNDAAAEFEPNGALFAFEDPAYGGLDPMNLVLTEPPRPEIYVSSNPAPSGTDEQLQFFQDLGFHPQTNAVTLVDVVVREGTDTLRASSAGVVSFNSATAENPRYPVGDGEGAPTESQMAAAAGALLERCLTGRAGAARLSLYAIAQEDAGTAVYFAYQLDGAAVWVGSDGYAARFYIEDGRIASFTLQLRRYEATGTTSVVLPEVQAAAAMEALGARGGELLLAYGDQRGDRVEAGWVSK